MSSSGVEGLSSPGGGIAAKAQDWTLRQLLHFQVAPFAFAPLLLSLLDKERSCV